MGKKRSIAELKEDGYKVPIIKWVFDRKPIYIATGVAGVIAVGSIVHNTQQSIHNIQNPPKPVETYQNIGQKAPQGLTWAKNFVKTAPTGEKNWSVSTNTASQSPVTFKECEKFGLPNATVMNSVVGQNDNLTVHVQLFNAGQAKKEFESYKKRFNSCFKTDNQYKGDPKTEVVTFDKGFFFSYGDAIIFVKSDKYDDFEGLINEYVSRAADSLKQNGCVSLTETLNDAKRNLYQDQKSYTGLIAFSRINTKVDLGNIPQPVYPEVKEETTMEQPEAPLPKSFKQLPKTTPEQPSIPEDPSLTKPQMSKEISYQVDDKTGPGCGWSWMSSSAPIVNQQELKNLENKARNDAQTFVDNNANDYVGQKIDFAKSLIPIMNSIQVWNAYVNDVNDVHSKWEWLNTEREKIQTPWYNYVQDHDSWINFDNEKTNAITTYNNTIDKCNAQNKKVEDWDKQWKDALDKQNSASASPSSEESSDPSSTSTESSSPTSSPSSSPSASSNSTTASSTASPTGQPTGAPAETIPPRPEACTEVPAIPEIAQQDKPVEPQMPVIPKDVTIPNSWPKPIKEPTVKVEKTD